MSKIPCIDCLTLSICKALKSRYKRKIHDGFFITVLEHRCSALAEYTRSRYEPACEEDPTIPVIEFFRGVSDEHPM